MGEMINPKQITNFNRTEAELQEFMLFCIMVHGKKAEVQAVKLEYFLTYLCSYTGCELPFQAVNIALNDEIESGEFGGIQADNMLLYALKKFGLGQYERLCRSIDDLVALPDIREVTVEQLETCFAVGPKTARFFVVHSRPNQQYAILDTHILKWLALNGVPAVPKDTPQGKWYYHYENIFLTFVKNSGLSVAEFDLNIWKNFAI